MPSLTSKDSHPLDQDKTRQGDALRAAERRRLARSLHRLGLAKLAAAFLESGGAFSTLAAQALYVSQPVLEPWAAKDKVSRLAELLENPTETAAFTQLLKGEIK